jgi:polyphosphate kinase
MAKALSSAARPRPARAFGERLLNRELSTLDFNGRVLELAADPEIPLLERASFCSICSSNLDHFFMVRVAGLLERAGAGLALRSADGRTASETLAEIRERVLALASRQSRLWRSTLAPALEAEGISIGDVGTIDKRELKERSDASGARSSRC